MQKHKPLAYAVLPAAFLLGALGLALTGISFVPFIHAKNFVDALAADGSSQQFNRMLFQQIAGRAWGAGCIVLIAGGILYAARKKAAAHANVLMHSSADELRASARRVIEVLRREDKAHLAALAAILLTAVVLRAWHLCQPIRYDEAFTFVQFAAKPLYRGLSDYSYPNNHPLHTLFVHIVYRLFGNQPWVIRLPAFGAGILTVAASYVTMRIMFDKRSALLTASLIAASPLLVLYSTNARGYMLICLIFISLCGLGAALLRRSTPARWLWFTLLSAAGFYTIPVMLYPFGIIMVWLGISAIWPGQRNDRSVFLKHMIISLVAVVLLTGFAYMPIIVVSGFESLAANRFVKPLPWTTVSTQMVSYLHATWVYLNRDQPAWTTLSCAAGFIASCALYRRLTDVTIPVIVAVPIWSIALLLVQRLIPQERVWLFLLPIYFGFASAGINYVLKQMEMKAVRHAPAAAFLNAAVPVMLAMWLGYGVLQTECITHSRETGTLPDAQQITIFMKDYLRQGDVVYASCPSDAPLHYYFTLHNLPTAYLSPHADCNPRRMVVIINHHAHQTLEGVLDNHRLQESGFSVVKVLAQYDSATLYELRRSDR